MCACEAAIVSAAEASAPKKNKQGEGGKRERLSDEREPNILALRQGRDVNGQGQNDDDYIPDL